MLNRETTTDDAIGAGNPNQARPSRVLSLVDKLNRDGAITVDMWMAAGTLRNQIMLEMPPSMGVSSYGANVRASEPSTKADRSSLPGDLYLSLIFRTWNAYRKGTPIKKLQVWKDKQPIRCPKPI